MDTTQKNAEEIAIFEVQNTKCNKEWSKPGFKFVSEIVETEGDPTISDDGLGDGLFS